jgi:hypothetical protein
MCAGTNATTPYIESQSGSMAKCPVCEERPATEFLSEFDGKVCSVCSESSKREPGWAVHSNQIELPCEDFSDNALSVQSSDKGYRTSAEGSTLCGTARGGSSCCEHEGCTKSGAGSTSYCIAHGGGKRCKGEAGAMALSLCM